LKPRDSYKPVDFTRLPIGYASAVTQLQIASVYAAIANGGVLMRPQILRRIEERNGAVILDFKPQPVRKVISERTSRDVMEALETVTGPGGTATTAALDYYTVAGKTGTAHKYTGDPDAPYDNKRYYGSFVGVFPASAPRICVAVTVNEPDKNKVGHYGGQVAGPLFVTVANMIGRHLNIQPDKSPNPKDQTQVASLEETEP
jgi:cell division protein FtsI/penicillin-binding protein 2